MTYFFEVLHKRCVVNYIEFFMKKRILPLVALSGFFCLGVSLCSASTDSLQDELSVPSNIFYKLTKDNLPHLYTLGLQQVLDEESKKPINMDLFLENYKMSSYPPLAGGEYIFNEYYMLGDGSCAKYAMGTTPQAAQRLLLDKGIARQEPLPQDEFGNPLELSEVEQQERAAAFLVRQQEAALIRDIAHLEMVDLAMDNPGALPSAIRTSGRYIQLVQALAEIDEQDIDADVAQVQKYALIATWAKRKKTFRDYVTHAFGAGVFTRFEQHFPGEEVRPYMINALAYAMKKNLNIWYQVVDEENVHDRPTAHLPQGQFVCVHDYQPNAGWPTAHLVHRGAQFKVGGAAIDAADHFNRLVPVGNQEETVQALEDEAKHLSDYLRSFWDSHLLMYYNKVKFNVLYDFWLTDRVLPFTLKIQAYSYCRDLVEEFKITDKNPLKKREIDLARVVMARAYALSVNQLEQKQSLTEKERARLQRSRQKQEGLRRVGLELESFSEKEIALMVAHLYQASVYERGFYEGRHIKPSENTQCAVAMEFHNAIKVLYAHEKRIILNQNLALEDESNRLAEGNSFFSQMLTAPYFFPEDPLPEEFDVSDYLCLNQDVVDHAREHGLNDHEFGMDHYKQFGRNEKRAYQIVPKEFKAQEYLALHPDIVSHLINTQASLSDALEFGRLHYRNWGCLKEKRAYRLVSQGVAQGSDQESVLPADFSAMTYLALCPDVLAHYVEQHYSLKQALQTATTHYLDKGIQEGRAYK
ncbi:MAG: hypothetical protein H2057_05375 [Alphaproteobacteria bacterium]|nr:hypothetical protein [Alphaproteobacteria bacterium]